MATRIGNDSNYSMNGRTIAVAANGNVYVCALWNDIANSIYNVRLFKVVGDSSTLLDTQTATQIHGANVQCHPGMVIDGSNKLHVLVYPSPGGNTRDLAYRVYNTSTEAWEGSWVQAQAVPAVSTFLYAYPMIDSNGKIHVLFGKQISSMGNAYHQVCYSNNVSGSWLSAETVSTGSTYQHYGVGGVVDSNNYVNAYYWRSDSKMCYRQRTTSWQTEGQETVAYGQLYTRQAVVDNSGNSYGINRVYVNPYYLTLKQGANAAVSTGIDVDDAYHSCLAYVDGKFLILAVTRDSNTATLYEYDGAAWNGVYSIGLNSAHAIYPKIAYQHHFKNYGANRHCIWGENANLYYELASGIKVQSTPFPAYLEGCGRPTDSHSAYLYGGYNRSHIHAMTEGFRDGYSAKHAWMRPLSPRVHCFTRAVSGVKIAVVPFHCRTSTGTQDITSAKLGDTPCKLAIFFGAGTTGYDSLTANTRLFFGATDGVHHFIRIGNGQDNYQYRPSGDRNSTNCAGFYTTIGNSIGGTAVFDSWISQGVRLNWTAGASTAWDCCAILFGAKSDDAFQAFVGTWDSIDGPELGEVINVECGFEPMSIIFHHAMDTAMHFGMGFANWVNDVLTQNCRGIDVDTGWNSDMAAYASTSHISGHRNATVSPQWQWSVLDRYATGFRLECHAAGSSQEYGFFIALRYAEDIHFERIRKTYSDFYYEPHIVTVPAQGKPLCMFYNTDPPFEDGSSIDLDDSVKTHGYYAIDDTNQECLCSWQGDFNNATVFHQKSVSTQGVHLYYDMYEAFVDRMTAVFNIGSLTVTETCSSTVAPYHQLEGILISQGIQVRSPRQPAYLFAHWRRCHAYLKGGYRPTSSKHAFFYVVDAQDHAHAYAMSIQPSRNSKPAYLMGKRTDAAVVMVPFSTTATATQDITSLELGGLQPKAAICLILEATAEVSDLELGWDGMGWGFMDGTHSFYLCWSGVDDTKYPYAFGVRYGYDAGFCVLTNTSGTVRLKGTFNSWLTNGVRVNWTTQSANRKGVMIFFAGSDVQAAMGNPTLVQNATNPINIGFQPDLIFFGVNEGVTPEFSMYASDNEQEVDTFIGIATRQNPWESHTFIAGFSAQAATQHCAFPGVLGMGLSIGYLNNDPYAAGSALWIHSWDATGFTLETGGAYTGGNNAFLAIGFGGKLQALLQPLHANLGQNQGKYTYQFPHSVFNLMTEFAWLFYGQGETHGPTGLTLDGHPVYSGTFPYDNDGPVWGLATHSQRWGASDYQGIFETVCTWPYSMWFAKVTGYLHSQDFILWGYHIYPETHEWKLNIKARLSQLLRSGLELDYLFQDNEPIPAWRSYVTSVPYDFDYPVLLIGTPEYKSLAHAYLKGLRDWWSRTPRGCYTIGQIIDSHPAYQYGQVEIGEGTSCYTCGMISPLANCPAYCYGVGEDLIPDGDTYRDSWLNENFGTVLYPSLADDSDLTYAFKDAVQEGDTFEVTLSNPQANVLRGNHYMIWRIQIPQPTALTITLQLDLLQGGTVIASDSRALSELMQGYRVPLTPEQIALITDYNNLSYRVTVLSLT